MEVGIELRAEAVNEGHRAEAGCAPGAWTLRAQAVLHCAQEQAQGRTLEQVDRIAGIHAFSFDEVRRRIAQGFRFITVMAETRMIRAAATEVLTALGGAQAAPRGRFRPWRE